MAEASLSKKPSWSQPTTDEKDEKLFFTCLRQHGKTAEFINYRFKDGSQKALSSSSIHGLEYDKGEGVVKILYGYATVSIKGRFLQAIYDQLLNLKVLEIREFLDEKRAVAQDECYISKIELESSLDEE